MKTMLRDYALGTTVHGFKHVAAPGSLCRRGFWVLLMLLSLSGLLFTTFSQVADMFSYPSIMSLNVELKSELPFPGVTICNLNQVRRSRVNNIEGLEELLLSTSDFVRNFSWKQPAHFQFENITSDSAFQIRSMAHTIEDTFDSCCWEGVEFPCEDLIQALPLDNNVCFVFNKPEVNHPKTFVTRNTGVDYGLRLKLNTMQDEYTLSSTTASAGFNVMLHDFHDLPATRTEGFVVSPGFSSSVRINLREIDFLGYPYKSYGNEYCLKRTDKNLKYFGKYDMNGCVLECKVEYVREKCGCKGIYDPDDVPGNFCSTHLFVTCYTQAEHEFWLNEHRACICPPTCVHRIYTPNLAMSYFPSDVLQERLTLQGNNQSSKEKDRSNYLELKIYYSGFMMERVEQSRVYTFQSIIATFGGQMGCYLGISFLSFFEVGELLICCLFRSRSKTSAQSESHTKATTSNVSSLNADSTKSTSATVSP